MFKQVSGEELASFDPETRELFTRREANPQTTFELMQIPRRARNHLPIFLDKDRNPRFAALEKEHNNFWWKFMLSFGVFGKFASIAQKSVAFACNEFSKIYYPYGIILRRSVPQSWLSYVRHRAPIGIVFLAAW